VCDYLQIPKGNKDKDNRYHAIVQNVADLKKMDLVEHASNFGEEVVENDGGSFR